MNLAFLLLQPSGIEVVVIGIGSGINVEELDHMAGGDGKAYTAESFDELTGASFTAKLTEASCKVGKRIFVMLVLV